VPYPALQSADFRRLLLAALGSALGSQMSVFALGMALYLATGSVASLAGLWAVRVTSRLVVQPFTGALADRWDRRRLLIGGYVLSGLVSASFALVMITPWLVYPLVFLAQSLEGLVGPALGAVVPRILPKSSLVSANALLALGQQVMGALGPALAGLLYAHLGPLPLFLFDGLSFWAVALAVWTLPAEVGAVPVESSVSLFAEVREGFFYALRDRAVLLLLGLSFLVSLFWRTVEIAAVPLALREASLGTEGLGLFFSSLALGGTLASAWLGAQARSVPGFSRIALFYSLVGLPFLLSAGRTEGWVWVLAFFLSGAAFSVVSAFANAYFQARVPGAFWGGCWGSCGWPWRSACCPYSLASSPLPARLGLPGSCRLRRRFCFLVRRWARLLAGAWTCARSRGLRFLA